MHYSAPTTASQTNFVEALGKIYFTLFYSIKIIGRIILEGNICVVFPRGAVHGGRGEGKATLLEFR